MYTVYVHRIVRVVNNLNITFLKKHMIPYCFRDLDIFFKKSLRIMHIISHFEKKCIHCIKGLLPQDFRFIFHCYFFIRFHLLNLGFSWTQNTLYNQSVTDFFNHRKLSSISKRSIISWQRIPLKRLFGMASTKSYTLFQSSLRKFEF